MHPNGRIAIPHRLSLFHAFIPLSHAARTAIKTHNYFYLDCETHTVCYYPIVHVICLFTEPVFIFVSRKNNADVCVCLLSTGCLRAPAHACTSEREKQVRLLIRFAFSLYSLCLVYTLRCFLAFTILSLFPQIEFAQRKVAALAL